jgi:hypothetical protein
MDSPKGVPTYAHAVGYKTPAWVGGGYHLYNPDPFTKAVIRKQKGPGTNKNFLSEQKRKEALRRVVSEQAVRNHARGDYTKLMRRRTDRDLQAQVPWKASGPGIDIFGIYGDPESPKSAKSGKDRSISL